ncbi:hypothetical protein COJ85_07780 [Bacillus sp. AFS076308]|uniref:CotO family spore coat protein n=1 Tax=Bacillus sp. AFS076308 TaxID=2033512 RepID=UPI000BF4848F|nr:CotO family spore coat protein [Bacillus sp. AFS076308]PFO06229.1 hypothetical protein COJ85_07780 [Bacillus sp. AFS076308]
MSTKKSQGPMLFIHQAFVRPPSNLNMQDVFTNRQEPAPLEDEQPVLQETKKTIPLAKEELAPYEDEQPVLQETKKTIPLAKEELAPYEDEPSVLQETKKTIPLAKEELVLENQDNSKQLEVQSTAKPKGKQRSFLKRVKPFKEMELLERLDYLINFPKVLPPVPCVFYTARGNFQGYLTEYTDQDVTIRFHNQTLKTIPLEQLTNVIMIGIQR